MPEIKAPITIITGDVDKTVSTNIHSRPLAATAPNVKLIVLPGVGHMIQNAVPDLVIAEIEAMISEAGCGSRGCPLRRARPRHAADELTSLRAGFRCSSREDET